MWIVCNPSRDVGSCWVHCPCTTLGGARAGGNIAEIVYHVANGCVVIIVTQPKARKREREREREGRRRAYLTRQPISLCKKNV